MALDTTGSCRYTSTVRLTTAHQMAIGSAIVLVAFYDAWELARYADSGAQPSLIVGVLAVAVSRTLDPYFRSLLRWFSSPCRGRAWTA